MKLLGLDLGQRRIGVAINHGDIVSSFETIVYRDKNEAISQILAICRREEIEKIILGLPLGQEKSEDKVRSFAMDLNKMSAIPTDFTDETLTSKEAERLLKDLKLNPRKEKYKAEIDRISAKLILEQYIRENSNFLI